MTAMTRGSKSHRKRTGYADAIRKELDRRVFNLRTLYDVSREIFGLIYCTPILKTFLMMIMGNLGALEGFILLEDKSEPMLQARAVYGLDAASLASVAQEAATGRRMGANAGEDEDHERFFNLTTETKRHLLVTRFAPSADAEGLFGLGPKINLDPYSDEDKELIRTLLNNLAVALQNARAFQKICRLNESLAERNRELQDALDKLQSALRKVEILESIKSSLSKFVPTTVCRMLESSPSADVFTTREQDVSVLFLDIEGYTKMCERLSMHELNRLVEKCFSPVLEAIYSHSGDVNETAGDGLMVLFLDQEPQRNALQAVRTALMVRDKISLLAPSDAPACPPLVINMGISSGTALVGAAKFESYTGSRWTYTARGSVTNLAARLGAFATGGQILLSKATADRIREHYQPVCLGSATLKNISRAVQVFAL